MSLMTSLYSGASGLEANSTDLSVIGDNIANANTIGFKGSRAAFEDQLAESLIGGAQRGLGVKLEGIQKLMNQGALTSTGNATDLAISGNGMFIAKGNHDGQEGQYYTRAGQFTLDKDGYLVNLDGLKIQGFGADASGTVGGPMGDLDLGAAVSSPNPTTEVTLKANLDATAAGSGPFDVNNATKTSDFQEPIQIYDSLGKEHDATIDFTKDPTSGAWTWNVVTDASNTAAGGTGPTVIGSGTLTFDGGGNLTGMTGSPITFNPSGSATQGQSVALNFGDPATGAVGVTDFASNGKSAASFLDQDGYASGDLANISVGQDGKVTGSFTNGQTRVLGEVAIATFQSPDQLQRIGGNLYSATMGSGPGTVGEPGTGGRGAVNSGALEQSNVDLAGEFISMIAAQRGFEANSKTVTTADQLLSDLMSMKR